MNQETLTEDLAHMLEQFTIDEIVPQSNQNDASMVFVEIEELISQRNYQDARGSLDRLSKEKSNLQKFRKIHRDFCENRALEEAIDTMEIILDIDPNLPEIQAQIENCYDIYKRKKAEETITKYLKVFKGEEHDWLVVELADYLLFFERQYSKSHLLYLELHQKIEELSVLGLNIEIGYIITEFLQNRKFTQELLYNSLYLLKETKQLLCTNHEKSYLFLKLGKLFYNISKPTEALQCLYDAHEIDREYSRPLFMLISMLELQHRMDLARSLLKETPPGHYKSFYYMAIYKQYAENHSDAIKLFTKSIEINKNYSKSYYLRGLSYMKLCNFNNALDDFTASFNIDENEVETQMQIIQLKQTLGIFDCYDNDKNKIAVCLDSYLHKTASYHYSINVMKPSDRPPMGLNSYYLWDLPFEELHKLGSIIAELNQEENELIIEEEKIKLEPFTFEHLQQELNQTAYKAIKVGFLIPESVDGEFMETFGEFFRLFEESKIMIYLYTMDRININSAYEQKLRSEVTVYTSLYQMTAISSAQKIYQHRINILINMCMPGLNKECQICQLKPAPIQINYFSTPGSSGMKCFDYLIADKYLCPVEEQCMYTEEIIMLPGAFACSSNLLMCENAVLPEERLEFKKNIEKSTGFVEVNNDKDSAILTIKQTEKSGLNPQCIYFPIGRANMRKDFEIPENAFVFATFSQFFKFDPSFLNMIIELLAKCENAFYLFIELPPEAVSHIKEYIQLQNEEIVKRIKFLRAYNENLAVERIRRSLIVDVYIDTVKLSGSIIFDEIFAGTVVVCQKGEFLGQRLTGSYLTELKLQELICSSNQEMKSKCLELYQDHEYFVKCKQIVYDNYLKLFDLQSFVSNYTRALQHVYQLWQNGLDPHSFELQGQK